jgi:hypothetical protein
MALETAQYISQLNPANPLSTDSVSQSDDHLRTIKLALTNTFPNLDGPVMATPAQLSNPVPKGAILMWSGDLIAIPLGYGLCDGTQGTPDLRNRFVIGAGDTYVPNATGGSANTGAFGSHLHTINNAGGFTPSTTTVTVQAGTGATALATIAPVADHTHTENLVGDHTHSDLPPYLALAYIMKL